MTRAAVAGGVRGGSLAWGLAVVHPGRHGTGDRHGDPGGGRGGPRGGVARDAGGGCAVMHPQSNGDNCNALPMCFVLCQMVAQVKSMILVNNHKFSIEYFHFFMSGATEGF